jgi:hypothetical protein
LKRTEGKMLYETSVSARFRFHTFAITIANIHKHSANTPEDTGILKIAPGRFSRTSTLFSNRQRQRQESGYIKVNSDGRGISFKATQFLQ